MVLVQKWPFFQLFFFVTETRKMSFTILQSKETSFQAIKTRSSKCRKVHIFPKGLTHGFGPKVSIFQPFFLGSIGQDIVFQDVLERKNAFLGYKNKKFKKSKNSHFSKGVNPWLCSKSAHFPKFLFLAIQAKKMCFTIFYEEKTPFQAMKTRSLHSQKVIFFERG